MAISFNDVLFKDLTLTLASGVTNYIEVKGTTRQVIGNIIGTGTTATLAYALESPSYVIASGLSDTDIQWIDFQSGTSTITTISGTLIKATIDAPNIIKVKNTSSSASIKVNFRGNR